MAVVTRSLALKGNWIRQHASIQSRLGNTGVPCRVRIPINEAGSVRCDSTDTKRFTIDGAVIYVCGWHRDILGLAGGKA